MLFNTLLAIYQQCHSVIHRSTVFPHKHIHLYITYIKTSYMYFKNNLDFLHDVPDCFAFKGRVNNQRLYTSSIAYWQVFKFLKYLFVKRIRTWMSTKYIQENMYHEWNHETLTTFIAVGRQRGRMVFGYMTHVCNQCLSPLPLFVRIPFRRGVLDTTLCDKVWQWIAAGRWFSLVLIIKP